MHGYLALRAPDGKIIASGNAIQSVHGDRVTSRVIFRFRDGSIDDETAVFTQRDHFKLITDHHIQKGPTFTDPTELSIDASTCQVTVRYMEHGKSKVDTEHIELPPDLANGLMFVLMKNIRPEMKETKVSYIAAAPKPRVVTFSIAQQGEDPFWTAGARQKATRYQIKVELGGLKGMIAPLIGKQPPDSQVWISVDDVPGFVKFQGALCLSCPMWSIEPTTPVWH